MVRVAVPELVRVTICAALVVPTVWLLKVRRVVDSVNFRGWFPLLGHLLRKSLSRERPRAQKISPGMLYPECRGLVLGNGRTTLVSAHGAGLAARSSNFFLPWNLNMADTLTHTALHVNLYECLIAPQSGGAASG